MDKLIGNQACSASGFGAATWTGSLASKLVLQEENKPCRVDGLGATRGMDSSATNLCLRETDKLTRMRGLGAATGTALSADKLLLFCKKVTKHLVPGITPMQCATTIISMTVVQFDRLARLRSMSHDLEGDCVKFLQRHNFKETKDLNFDRCHSAQQLLLSDDK